MATEGERGGSTGPDDDVPLQETVARNVPIVLFALDGEGRFTRSEGRGLATLGLEQDEVVGESVFEAGYTTGEGGTGLGLAIVSEIAGAHGWTVSVEDGRDDGARFVVAGVDRA